MPHTNCGAVRLCAVVAIRGLCQRAVRLPFGPLRRRRGRLLVRLGILTVYRASGILFFCSLSTWSGMVLLHFGVRVRRWHRQGSKNNGGGDCDDCGADSRNRADAEADRSGASENFSYDRDSSNSQQRAVPGDA